MFIDLCAKPEVRYYLFIIVFYHYFSLRRFPNLFTSSLHTYFEKKHLQELFFFNFHADEQGMTRSSFIRQTSFLRSLEVQVTVFRLAKNI